MIAIKDNCLFIHIPKVAGQSIEQVFLHRAGLGWEDKDSFFLKQNYKPELGPPRLAHLTLSEYVKYNYLTTRELNTIFKFAFVRNPWSRLVSEYVYRGYPFSFKDFVFTHFPKPCHDDYKLGKDAYRHVIPQYQFIYDHTGEIAVDFIGKFESIHKDFAQVTKLITGEELSLPHRNKSKIRQEGHIFSRVKSMLSNQSRHEHYSEYYDAESKEWVANYYKKDIELFGYNFV